MASPLEAASVTADGASPAHIADDRARRRAHCLAIGAAIGVIAVALGAVGILVDLLAPDPLTHLGVALLGVAPLIPRAPRWRPARLALATVLVGGGAAALATWLVDHAATDVAPMTSACFALCGLSVGLHESARPRVHRLGVACSIVVIFAGLTFGIGALYSGDPELGLLPSSHITLPTAVTLCFAAMGWRLSRPDGGALGLALSSSAASLQLLLMIPATLFVPAIIGALYVYAAHRGVVSIELGQVFVTLATTVMISAIVVWTARAILRFEAHRLADARALREAHDGLERRVAERTAELASATARWRAVLDGVNAAIITIGPDGRVTDFNRTAERWLGYTAAEVVGRATPALWHDLDELARLAPAAAAADTAAASPRSGDALDGPLRALVGDVRVGEPRVLECVYRRRDGSRLQVLLAITRIEDPARQLSGFTSVAVDIEERRAFEAALVHAKESAEAATRARAEFVARMSHEIRTPLNGVQGFLALALDTGLDAEQRDFVTGARDAASHLLRLVDDILDFSKIDARKLELEAIPMTLSAVLDSTLRPLALRARAKGLVFAVEVGDGVPDRLTGDPTRLGQVLVNLVGNAVKFTERGRVTVTVDVAEELRSAVLLRFRVKDSGIGIPPDKQAQVFQPFGQADEATARRYGGTGLGLVISAELVRLMGGTLSLESALGEGTTFTFTATLATRTRTVTRPRALAAPAALRVLVADDNPTNLLLAGRLLERAGHVVTTVTDGRQALQAASGGTHDVVILDIQMPELDGLEVTRALREAERGSERRLPIIGLSAHVLASDRQRCIDAGMDAYVTKPFNAHDLVAAIDRVVRGVE